MRTDPTKAATTNGILPEAAQSAVEHLYRELHAAWNHRDASAFAALFAEHATCVGFDGTTMTGPAEIEASLAKIFGHHKTPRYVAIVRSVRPLSAEVMLLFADTGLVPEGQSDPRADHNAIQCLVASNHGDGWRIEHFQNTPAAFHGRPEAVEALTEELRAALRDQQERNEPSS
jgi:uncharacterized protein (TIGR02246 family)